jgi:hypothetical protein
MSVIRPALAPLTCCLVLFFGALTAAAAPALSLKRVMLSTGGVAYLEYEAEVSGDAELTLDLALDQVDDVLKSIVVHDSKGSVGSARLAGRDPLPQIFRELPFDEAALASPAALLGALRGADIKIGSSRPIAGKLLAVVTETAKAGELATTERHRVSVMTATGLQQFILEDAESVSFVEPELQAKVDKALAAVAAQHAKGRRQILLTTKGSGPRLVRVGYVVAAPLWKASFRMTLPESPSAERARLQGWAVLENMSGQDWQNVELTLLSGNPVSFRQAIYEAYYVRRPEVPVEVAGRVLPRPDRGVMKDPEAPRDELGGRRADLFDKKAAATGAAAAPPRSIAADMVLQSNMVGIAGPTEAAESIEALTQVSFRLPSPITVASGQSAILPLFDQELPVARFALYQPETSPAHPLAALRLRNSSATGLPPGVLTLYEEAKSGIAYLGDARLPVLPAGEERLLSYAVDEKIKLSREARTTNSYTKGAIAQGVLRLTRVVRQTTVYQIAAPAAEPRRVLVEQAKRQGWRLVEPAERAVEQTADVYRAAVDLKPGESKTLTFTLEMPASDTIRMVDVGNEQIAAVAESQEIAPAVKSALAEMARLRRIVSDKQAAENQLAKSIEALRKDQERIRENLSRGNINQGSALYKRYIEKLTEQETQFEKLQSDAAAAAEETRAATAAIDAYIAKLTV